MTDSVEINNEELDRRIDRLIEQERKMLLNPAWTPSEAQLNEYARTVGRQLVAEAQRIGDPEKLKAAHEQLSRATGAPNQYEGPVIAAHSLISAPIAAVGALSEITNLVSRFATAAVEVLALLDQLEDDEGRQIWMTSGEVELEQWLDRVTKARDALAKALK